MNSAYSYESNITSDDLINLYEPTSDTSSIGSNLSDIDHQLELYHTGQIDKLSSLLDLESDNTLYNKFATDEIKIERKNLKKINREPRTKNRKKNIKEKNLTRDEEQSGNIIIPINNKQKTRDQKTFRDTKEQLLIDRLEVNSLVNKELDNSNRQIQDNSNRQIQDNSNIQIQDNSNSQVPDDVDHNLNEWLDLSNQIKEIQEKITELNKLLKKIRAQRNKISRTVTTNMKKHNIETVKKQDQEVKCVISYTKLPYSRKYITEKLTEYFKDKYLADKIAEFLDDSRPKRERKTLKVVKPEKKK